MLCDTTHKEVPAKYIWMYICIELQVNMHGLDCYHSFSCCFPAVYPAAFAASNMSNMPDGSNGNCTLVIFRVDVSSLWLLKAVKNVLQFQ